MAGYFAARIFSSASFDSGKFLLICGSLFFVQIFFLALGYVIAVVVPKIKTVLAYSLPVIFGFFIIGLLDSVIGVETARYITPFKYFDVGYILANGGYDLKYVITESVFVLVCITAAYIIYLRKDMRAPA